MSKSTVDTSIFSFGSTSFITLLFNTSVSFTILFSFNSFFVLITFSSLNEYYKTLNTSTNDSIVKAKENLILFDKKQQNKTQTQQKTKM